MMNGGKFNSTARESVLEEVKGKLQGNGFVLVGTAAGDVQQYATRMDIDNLPVLLMVKSEGSGVTVNGKVGMAPIVDLLKQSLTLILGVK